MAETAISHYHAQGIPVRQSETNAPVTGIVLSPKIDSVISYLALTLMGHVVLLISPHLTTDILEHLVCEANCKLVLGTAGGQNYKGTPLATVDDLLQMDGDASPPPTAISPHGDEPVVMLHSSGRTGRPKLIAKSHRSLLLLLRNMHSSMHDTDVLVSSWMYWLAGFCMMLFAFVKSGSRVCWPSEDYSAPVQTIKRLLLETRSQITCCTAALLIPASKTGEGLGVLKECAMIVNPGGVFVKVNSHSRAYST